MRKIAQFADCIIRWGGGGGAMLGTLLYVLWLASVVVSDIARTGSWSYYNLVYIVLELFAGASIGFILGILMALINSAAMILLIAAFRLHTKSANIPPGTLAVTFILVSGVGMLVCLSLSGFTTSIGWLIGAVIPTMLAVCWAWLVASKSPVITLQR